MLDSPQLESIGFRPDLPDVEFRGREFLSLSTNVAQGIWKVVQLLVEILAGFWNVDEIFEGCSSHLWGSLIWSDERSSKKARLSNGV